MFAFVKITMFHKKTQFTQFTLETLFTLFIPKTLKYWVGVQRGQSYLTGRRCLFSFGWLPF